VTYTRDVWLFSLRFEKSRTVFSFSCPVTRAKWLSTEQIKTTESFRLPSNVWAFGLDDSRIQRKLLCQIFKFLGIPRERSFVLGATGNEVSGFISQVKQKMYEHGSDRFLLIVDENLDIAGGELRHNRVSGSEMVEQLRHEVDEAAESRMLALIRSASESVDDISRYQAKAHGYLLKEPVTETNATESIRPWWLQRFPDTNL
jgi:hypothetical protein